METPTNPAATLAARTAILAAIARPGYLVVDISRPGAPPTAPVASDPGTGATLPGYVAALTELSREGAIELTRGMEEWVVAEASEGNWTAIAAS